MPRKRKLDPIGLSDQPTVVTDPARVEERVAEFRRRLHYFDQHYRMGERFFGGVSEYNEAIAALRDVATGEFSTAGAYKRLPPMIELVVSVHARRFATERTGQVEAVVIGQDVRRASENVATTLRPIGNRPRADNLIYHVRGLMALVQDFSGRPVVPRRYRNSVYDPHFMPGVSRIVPRIMRNLAPKVSVAQLVTIAENARKDWAGNRPRFKDYFPGYGLQKQPDGSLAGADGTVVCFTPNVPTYFHSRD